MMTNARFIYFRDNLEATNHNGIICAGYRDEEDVCLIAFAFCSPEDRFEKKIARDIINNRFDNDICIRIEKSDNLKLETYRDWVSLVMEIYNSNIGNHAFAQGIFAPSWARRFILPNRPLNVE